MDSITKSELNDYLFVLLGDDRLVALWWDVRNVNLGAAPSSVWETDPQKVVDYVLGQIS